MTTPDKAEAMAAEISVNAGGEDSPIAIPAGFHQWDPDRDRGLLVGPVPVLGEAALQNQLGEYIKLVNPYTEATPPGMLAAMATILGNMIGRTTVMRMGPTVSIIPTFLTVLLGESNTAAKGQADSEAGHFMSYVDPFYITEHSVTGIRSGQALIKRVSDKTEKNPGGREDQRVILQQGELSRLFDSAGIQGSTLSDDLKMAFDNSYLPLGNTAEGSGDFRSTNHVISVLGGITPKKLRTFMTPKAAEDGHGNRYVYIWSEIPDDGWHSGGSVRPPEVERQAQLIAEDIGARLRGRMKGNRPMVRSPEAVELWDEWYIGLAKPTGGEFMRQMLARGRLYVAKFENFFAALEGFTETQPRHLLSARAVWDYSAQSVEYVFGQSVGIGKTDRVLNRLRADGKPVIRSKITYEDRKVSAHDLDEAIVALLSRDLIAVGEIPGDGRTAQALTAIAPDTGQLNDNDNNNDQEVGR